MHAVCRLASNLGTSHGQPQSTPGEGRAAPASGCLPEQRHGDTAGTRYPARGSRNHPQGLVEALRGQGYPPPAGRGLSAYPTRQFGYTAPLASTYLLPTVRPPFVVLSLRGLDSATLRKTHKKCYHGHRHGSQRSSGARGTARLAPWKAGLDRASSPSPEPTWKGRKESACSISSRISLLE